MSTETIIWTVLPATPIFKVKAQVLPQLAELKLSVFVSMRLKPTGHLSDFALDNWPQRVAELLSFSLEFEGGPTLPARIDKSALDPNLWEALFPENTSVNGYALQPQANRKIWSFPVRNMHQFVRSLYGQVASDPKSATEFPSLKTGPVADLIRTVGRIDETLSRREHKPIDFYVKMNEDVILDELGDRPALDFFRTMRFYRRGNANDVTYAYKDKPPMPDPIAVPEFDFHEALTLLGDHPHLMRVLGIAIPCTVRIGNLAVPEKSRVRVSNLSFKGGTPPSEDDKTPWTNYRLDAHGFWPCPKSESSDLSHGFLRLGSEAFEVSIVDVDGAAFNIMQFATNMRRLEIPAIAASQQAPVPGDKPHMPDNASLPALTGGGFTVSRVNRAEKTKERLNDALAHNSGLGMTSFNAEDLLRGFRIDVWDDRTRAWHSLCRRVAFYRFPGRKDSNVKDFHVAEEGYVKSATATSNPGSGPTDELYLHEALFGWSGWSLVAARPGRTLTFGEVLSRPAPNAAPPGSAFQLEPEIHAEPKTLPKLRYGRIYRLRARLVDLAGNGQPWDSAEDDESLMTKETSYTRWEPIAPPALALRTRLTEGEQIETMVIRTRVNPSDSDLKNKLPHIVFNKSNERHLVPPKTSQIMVETHGMLDKLTSEASYDISRKENGTLQDIKVMDEETGLPVDVKDSMELIDGRDTPKESLGKWPEPGQPLARGQYILHKDKNIRLPYLPDPMSAGVVLSLLPDLGIKPYLESWIGSYPSYGTKRLVLLSGGTPAMGAGLIRDNDRDNEIQITLPPASIVKLRYRSSPDKDRLQDMAVWDIMTMAARESLKEAVVNGQHWMLTPYREIKLVHAVEKPLKEPATTSELIDENGKAPGQTYSRIRGFIQNDAHSTGELELVASWEEVEDRLGVTEGETRELRRGHVADLKVEYDQNRRLFPLDFEQVPRHEFGDTKHRWVKYSSVATTRYREYFPAALAARRELITTVEQVPEDLPNEEKNNILSAARPDPPRVLYIVPTFKWVTSKDGRTQRRIGRSLRVYLDRPWFSSGDDERLGVVLVPPAQKTTVAKSPEPLAVRPYVSEWGSDPVMQPPIRAVDSELGADHFISKDKVEASGLTLAELPGDNPSLTVNVVAFPVEFNQGRQLWFCDIEMNPLLAYFPYVRLALARYQPHSIPNAHLSRVVRTEYAQLVADRTANLKYLPNGDIEVTVIGFSSSAELGQQLPVRLPPTKAPASTGKSEAAKPSRAATGEKASVEASRPQVEPDQSVQPGREIYIADPAAGAGHSVRVHIEGRPRGGTDLAWKMDPPEVELASFTLAHRFEVFWRGRIRQPEPRDGARAPEYRLVIREFELYRADRDATAAQKPTPALKVPHGERLVYADIFPLDVGNAGGDERLRKGG